MTKMVPCTLLRSESLGLNSGVNVAACQHDSSMVSFCHVHVGGGGGGGHIISLLNDIALSRDIDFQFPGEEL